MKFVANPDKFISCIGFCIVIFLFIFSYMILNHLLIFIPLLILWIGFSVFVIKRNYVLYMIQDEKIIIQSFKKNFEIQLNEIEYIVEFSDYTKSLKEKKYKLILSEKLKVPEKFLEIENRTFTKWILKNEDRFKIKKVMTLD